MKFKHMFKRTAVKNDAVNEKKTRFSARKPEVPDGLMKKCNACKNLSCNRCVYINKKMTNEFRVSPEIQCELSSITQKIADDLKEKLDEKNEALIKEMVNL